MAVFRVERNKGYTVMSNHHLRNKELSLKAKGLLSQKPSIRKLLSTLKEAAQGKNAERAKVKNKDREVSL